MGTVVTLQTSNDGFKLTLYLYPTGGRSGGCRLQVCVHDVHLLDAVTSYYSMITPALLHEWVGGYERAPGGLWIGSFLLLLLNVFSTGLPMLSRYYGRNNLQLHTQVYA